jgi:hypothetical protein
MGGNRQYGDINHVLPQLHLPAFTTSQFETGRFVGDMFVFEANLVRLWSLATRAAQLDFPLVNPSLIGRGIFDVFRCLHLTV